MKEGCFAIIGAAIGAASTLLGVVITQFYESRKRASEEKRWYAEFFFVSKFDALNNLYSALVECDFTMNFYGNVPPSTMQEFKEKIQPKEEAYLRAKVMASIYLDHEADEIMSASLGAFRQASAAIWLHLPDYQSHAQKDSYDLSTRNLDWHLFGDTYEKAVDCLKKKLNPQLLERFENTKKM